jgi:hypothetical protein
VYIKHKDVVEVTIKEVRQTYGTQIRSYHEHQIALQKQKNDLERKINTTPDGKNVYANEAAVLELSIQAVNEKQSEYQAYMEKVTEQWAAVANMESAKQQGEAMEEYAIDMGKIMEVARRLMKGAIVPPTDEKKLMDYSMEMYQAAKNMGALARQKEKEEYDSLWDDEKEPEEITDPMEVADNTEVLSDGPEIVEVSEVIAGTVGGSE